MKVFLVVSLAYRLIVYIFNKAGFNGILSSDLEGSK